VAALQNGTVLPKDAHWASVIISTNSQPDEIMAVAASYDSTLRYGAQTPFSDQLSHMWEGGQWEYDTMHDSIITAGNGGSKPVKAAFTIFYDQGQQKYELEQALQPDEQMWIDVGKLIRERVPDKTGKLLPQELQAGSYQFRELSDAGVGSLFEGKVIYDQTFGHVSYGCAACCATGSIQLQYNPFGIGVSFQGLNQVQGLNSCTNGWTDINQDFPNWKTANTAIATTTNVGLHTGMSVGGTTSSTYGYVVKTNGRNGCYEVQDVPASGPTNVSQLKSFQIVVVNPAPSGTTNSVISKIQNQIKVTALDQNNAVMSKYNGSVTFSSSDPIATLPATYTFTAGDAGAHTFNVTLATVNLTSSTRNITVKDTVTSVTSTNNVYVWFNVIASDEGLVGGTTAYGHVIAPNDHFVALPSTGLGSVPVVLQRNSIQQSTTVLDVGPWCPHSSATTGNPCVCNSDPYWATSGVPYAATNSCSTDHAGIDLADGTFSGIGLTGNGSIYWRFQ
jgi:hypothetical protein